jgi:hypothetical protein
MWISFPPPSRQLRIGVSGSAVAKRRIWFLGGKQTGKMGLRKIKSYSCYVY